MFTAVVVVVHAVMAVMVTVVMFGRTLTAVITTGSVVTAIFVVAHVSAWVHVGLVCMVLAQVPVLVAGLGRLAQQGVLLGRGVAVPRVARRGRGLAHFVVLDLVFGLCVFGSSISGAVTEAAGLVHADVALLVTAASALAIVLSSLPFLWMLVVCVV
jgi:hypothetical protein